MKWLVETYRYKYRYEKNLKTKKKLEKMEKMEKSYIWASLYFKLNAFDNCKVISTLS